MFDSRIDSEHAFGHHGSMTRTHVRRRRTLLSLLSILLLTLLLGPVGHALQAGAAVRHPATVVVRPGDSLWTIARRVHPATDPRAVVADIVAANTVDAGALRPGTRLVVPES